MAAPRVEVVQYFGKTRAFLRDSATFSGTKSHLTENYRITKKPDAVSQNSTTTVQQ